MFSWLRCTIQAFTALLKKCKNVGTMEQSGKNRCRTSRKGA